MGDLKRVVLSIFSELVKFNEIWYNIRTLNLTALIQRSKINEIKATT